MLAPEVAFAVLLLLGAVKRLTSAEADARLLLVLVELHLVLLYLVRHRQEGALHVHRLLGRSLQERDFVLLPQLLSFLKRYLPLALEVAFVPHQDLAHARSRELVDLRHPRLHVLEGVPVRHVVDDDYSVRASVV